MSLQPNRYYYGVCCGGCGIFLPQVQGDADEGPYPVTIIGEPSEITCPECSAVAVYPARKLVRRRTDRNGNFTQPSPDFSSDEDYWLALGQFMEAFAIAEGMLFMYLIHATGIQKMVGKALFGGDSCSSLVDKVRVTWTKRPPPDTHAAPLDDALAQLKRISGVRNEVIHNRSYMFPDRGRVSTNRLRAHDPEKIRERQVSPTLLASMTADLERIRALLVLVRASIRMRCSTDYRRASEFFMNLGGIASYQASG